PGQDVGTRDGGPLPLAEPIHRDARADVRDPADTQRPARPVEPARVTVLRLRRGVEPAAPATGIRSGGRPGGIAAGAVPWHGGGHAGGPAADAITTADR